MNWSEKIDFILDSDLKCKNIYFNDKKGQILISYWDTKKCKLYKYSDLLQGSVNSEEKLETRYESHKFRWGILGSLFGNLLGTFIGVLHAQNHPKEYKERFLYNPSVTLMFRDGALYQCYLYKGKLQRYSIRRECIKEKIEEFNSKTFKIEYNQL